MDNESDLPQDYEQIPWSHLVPVQKDRSLQMALVVVVAVAVFLAVVFFIRRSPAITPIMAAAPPTTVLVEVTTPPPPPALQPPSVETPLAVTTPAQPQIYSEADLMAVLPPPSSALDLMAVARAEWFVTDYFTVDGDGSLAEGVVAVLPDVVSLPSSDGSTISYVEWARAVAVEAHLDGSFDVTVWFRTLVGNLDGGFSRTDVRAVDVRLVTDAAGRLAVADVPAITVVVPVGIAPAWPEDGVPPDSLVVAAAESTAAFGTDPELEAAGLGKEGWRLVFSIGDASGLRFPILVRIPGQ